MSKSVYFWPFLVVLVANGAIIGAHHLDISITQHRNMESNDNGEEMSAKSSEMSTDTEHFMQNNAKQEKFGRIQLASESSEQGKSDRFSLTSQQDQKNLRTNCQQ